MKFAALLIVAAFGACLIWGVRSGKMLVKWFPDADREANPLYFWSVTILYVVFVAFGVWELATPR